METLSRPSDERSPIERNFQDLSDKLAKAKDPLSCNKFASQLLVSVSAALDSPRAPDLLSDVHQACDRCAEADARMLRERVEIVKRRLEERARVKTATSVGQAGSSQSAAVQHHNNGEPTIDKNLLSASLPRVISTAAALRQNTAVTTVNVRHAAPHAVSERQTSEPRSSTPVSLSATSDAAAPRVPASPPTRAVNTKGKKQQQQQQQQPGQHFSASDFVMPAPKDRLPHWSNIEPHVAPAYRSGPPAALQVAVDLVTALDADRAGLRTVHGRTLRQLASAVHGVRMIATATAEAATDVVGAGTATAAELLRLLLRMRRNVPMWVLLRTDERLALNDALVRVATSANVAAPPEATRGVQVEEEEGEDDDEGADDDGGEPHDDGDSMGTPSAAATDRDVDGTAGRLASTSLAAPTKDYILRADVAAEGNDDLPAPIFSPLLVLDPVPAVAPRGGISDERLLSLASAINDVAELGRVTVALEQRNKRIVAELQALVRGALVDSMSDDFRPALLPPPPAAGMRRPGASTRPRQQPQQADTPTVAPPVRLPAPRLVIFGSAANGFGSAKSDIDVALDVVPDALPWIRGGNMTEAFHVVRRRLAQRNAGFDVWMMVLPGRGAVVPLLRMTHRASGVPVDLGFRCSLSVLNTRLLSTYAAIDERLVQVGLALKAWARARGVSDASAHYLSSYAWVLYSIFFFQRLGLVPCLQDEALINPFVAERGPSAAPLLVVDGHAVRFVPDAAWARARVRNSAGVAHDARAAAYLPAGVTLRNASSAHLVDAIIRFLAREPHVRAGVVSVRVGSYLDRDAWTRRRATRSPPQPAGATASLTAAADKPRRSAAPPAWRLSVEDPFDETHDLGRALDELGAATIRVELDRAVCVLDSGSPAALWAPVTEQERVRIEEIFLEM